MRDSHKHLMWFLLAVTAALWGFTHRVLHRSEPDGNSPAKADRQATGEPHEPAGADGAPTGDGGVR